MYIHERADWPKLHWSSEALTSLLAEVRHLARSRSASRSIS